VVLYKIVGGGHPWPGGTSRLPERLVGRKTMEIDAVDVIVDFFGLTG